MGRPSYDPIKSRKETLLTLLLLNNGSFGRYTLSKYLGLTKAKTRTILELLNDYNLAISSKGRGGTQLTKQGRALLRLISNFCLLDWHQDIVEIPKDFVDHTLEKAVLFFKIEKFSSNGLYERDLAVRNGANGAITLERKSEHWIFPNDETEVERVKITKSEKISNYNIMIITFGDELGVVYSAISEILLYHLEDELEKLLPK